MFVQNSHVKPELAVLLLIIYTHHQRFCGKYNYIHSIEENKVVLELS